MQTNTLKILIVDDQQDNLQLMLNCLFEGGYFNILCSTSGEDSIEIVQKENPDLILMDWDMPGMSGIETIKKLQKLESAKNVPMIITTGAMLTNDDLKFALESGATDYIRKPFNKIELLARVKSAIEFSKLISTIEKQKIEIIGQKEELLENEKRLEAIINATMEAVIFVKDDIITEASSRFIDFTGFQYDELVGKSMLSMVMPEDRTSLVELETEQKNIVHLSLITKDKNYLPCKMYMHPIKIKGELIQVISVWLHDDLNDDGENNSSKINAQLKLENDTLKENIASLKRELEYNTLKSYQSNELFHQLLNKLKSLKDFPDLTDKKNQNKIAEIIQEINMVINDNIWDELKMRINEVHSDFYTNLLNKFPSLTETDLRLLAFLKLNLSTKEIADITFQQINTIKAARKRIRQKLNIISEDISLSAFLSKF